MTQWGLWIYRLLLTLGVTLILSAILYYCAFNFYNIPALIKLTSLMGLFSLAIIGFYVMRDNALISELCLFVAVFLIGIFWAVFGQIYQTGADSYQLFLAWGLMALPFIVLQPKASLIALGVVIALLFIGLYGDQGELPVWFKPEMIFIPMMLLPFGLLFIKINKRWFIYFMLILTLSFACFAVAYWIFDSLFAKNESYPAITALLITAILFVYYRFKSLQIGPFALVIIAVTIDLHTLMLERLMKWSDPLNGLFLGGLLSLAIFAIAVMILKNAYGRVKHG